MTSRSSFGSRGRSSTLSSSSSRVSSASSRSISSRAICVHLVVGVRRRRAARARRPARRGRPRAGGRPRRSARACASSWPSRRISDGSEVTSGSAEVVLDLVVLARDLGQLGVEVAHDPGGGSPGGRGRRASAGFGPSCIGSRSNGVEPAGTASPSASSACSIDTIATSIMSSVGRLGRDHLDQDARVHAATLTSGLLRWRAPKREDLVADGGDDRDQQRSG